ncbi:hypothetical protein DIE19_34435 [Burkholderia sp. Bp9126]|nr:hypothetical protein DIE19_34435 [Burkholderia sp. Bp9126]
MELTRFRGHLSFGTGGASHGKPHNPYAPEFRAQMVELVKAGRTPEDLAREFEPTAQTIYNWVAQPIATPASGMMA